MLRCSLLDQGNITLEPVEEAGALVGADLEEVVDVGFDGLDDGAELEL